MAPRKTFQNILGSLRPEQLRGKRWREDGGSKEPVDGLLI